MSDRQRQPGLLTLRLLSSLEKILSYFIFSAFGNNFLSSLHYVILSQPLYPIHIGGPGPIKPTEQSESSTGKSGDNNGVIKDLDTSQLRRYNSVQ